MTQIEKTFTVRSKAVDAAAGIYEAMISTETVDRQGDIVRAGGAKIDNFMKNPVVLFGHSYDQPPVAKTLAVEKIPGLGLKARFQFPRKGISTFADTVHGLWAEGYINATSIGFIPLKSVPIDPGKPYGPQEFQEWEMLEFSLVPVPANQEAVRLALRSFTGRGRSNTEYAPETIKAIGEFFNALAENLGVDPRSRAIRAERKINRGFEELIQALKDL